MTHSEWFSSQPDSPRDEYVTGEARKLMDKGMLLQLKELASLIACLKAIK